MTEKEELISIIVPVYNVEAYIEQCLDSLMNQTYRNLEIILIDDGSTDNSGKICEAYEKKDCRIKYFYQTNMGVGAARNKGIDFAAGKYIGFVDPDDYCDLEMFRSLYQLIVEYKADIACCRWYNMRRKEMELGGYVFAEKEKVLTNLEVANIYTKIMDWAVWNKLYKKELIKKIRFPKVRYGEDFFTVFQWLYAADRIVYTSNPLIYYRLLRDGSSTTLKNNLALKITCSLQQLQQMQSFLMDVGQQQFVENFNIRYIRSLYDLRCNIESVRDTSTQKETLIAVIQTEITKLNEYKKTLDFSKRFKLFLLDNFRAGYKLVLIWECKFKNIEKRIRNKILRRSATI